MHFLCSPCDLRPDCHRLTYDATFAPPPPSAAGATSLSGAITGLTSPFRHFQLDTDLGWVGFFCFSLLRQRTMLSVLSLKAGIILKKHRD